MTAPSFQTARLALRPFRPEDASTAHAWFSDPAVMRYIVSGLDTSLEMSTARVQSYIEHQARHGFSKWIIEERATGELIGDAGIMDLPVAGGIELGYRLARPFWGRGYASEAAAGWLAYAFGVLRLPRLVAFAHMDNAPSIHILEKIGMSRTHFGDVLGFPVVFYAASRDAL